MVWLARIAFIFCITFAQATAALISNAESNIAFIEKTIVDITAPLIDTLKSTTAKHLVLSCRTGSDQPEPSLFLQDIISRQLLRAGFIVYLHNGAPEKSADAIHSNTLDIVLDEWLLTAHKSGKERSQKHIYQEFSLRIRYRIMSSTRQVLYSGTKAGKNTKVFDDLKSFRLAQEGQPEFARANPSFATQKNNLIGTLLISGVTGITIFLIYALRSQ